MIDDISYAKINKYLIDLQQEYQNYEKNEKIDSDDVVQLIANIMSKLYRETNDSKIRLNSIDTNCNMKKQLFCSYFMKQVKTCDKNCIYNLNKL